MKSRMTIVSSFINPPIPIRTCDWCAYLDGEEEGKVGWGRKQLDAINDLLEQLDEN